MLEDFAKQHAPNEPEGWLINAVRFHQGSVLHIANDLTGALQKHREVRTTLRDRPYFILNSFCIARLLDKLGKPQQALSELESALSNAQDSPEMSDLASLVLYADLAERLGYHLPDWFVHMVQTVVRLWHIPLADEDLGDRNKVAAALEAAEDARADLRNKT